ncbi:hypothetical protein [Roseovarius pacificus]|uniref:hypothetical protein n=1 Tax=Roseovarius pacificus TaxID=337701 RepID=UPI004039B834
MTNTNLPDRIFMSPKDAELFGQKYGHPNVKQAWVGEAYVEYARVENGANFGSQCNSKSRGTNEAKHQERWSYPDWNEAGEFLGTLIGVTIRAAFYSTMIAAAIKYLVI